MNATQTTSSGTDSQSHALRPNVVPHPGPLAEPAPRSGPAPARPGGLNASQLPVAPEMTAQARKTIPSYRGRKQNFGVAVGAFSLLALLGCLFMRYATVARSWVKTDNAYLAAHIHAISPRLAGTVQEVLVDENQTVASGAVLARLDPRDFEVRLRQAQALAAQAKAQWLEAQARIAQARAQVSREEARAVKARADRVRAESLYGKGSGAISKQELDLARAEAQAAEAAFEGAEASTDSAIASGKAAEAVQQAAEATVREAELRLSYTEILAPAAGRIGKKNLETGNHVQPGQPVMAVVQTDLWVTANFKETQLTHLKPGQPARVRVDAFPGRILRGKIASLSPGSGAQFALLPPDNATGNFTRIVQRVPVRIDLEPSSLGDLEGRLVAGMSAVVEIHVHE